MYKPNSGLHSKVEQHLPWLSPCCNGARVGGQALRPLLTWTADSPSPLLTNGHLLLTPLGELKGQKVLSALQISDWFAVQMLKADCSTPRLATWPIPDKHEYTSGWSPTIPQNTSGPLSVGNSSFPSTVLYALPRLNRPAPSPSDFSDMTDTWSLLFPKLQGTPVRLSLPPSCWDGAHNTLATSSPSSKSPSSLCSLT